MLWCRRSMTSAGVARPRRRRGGGGGFFGGPGGGLLVVVCRFEEACVAAA